MIASLPTDSMGARIMRNIHEAIAARTAEIRSRVMAEASKKFEDELREAIAKVAVTLTDYYSVQRAGSELVIRVRIEGKE